MGSLYQEGELRYNGSWAGGQYHGTGEWRGNTGQARLTHIHTEQGVQ